MDRTDQSGNRIGARRTVGPADPATVRAALAARLSETQPAPRAKPAATPVSTTPTTGVSPNAYRLLKNRGKQTDKAVDDAS